MSVQLRSIFKKTNNWINQTIRRRLGIWSISYWVVSVIILSVIFLYMGQNQIIDETQLRNTQFASTISRDVNTQISNVIGNIRTFTQHIVTLESDLKTQSNALLGLRLSSVRYRALYYFDTNGTLLFDLTDTTANLLTIRTPEELINLPVVPAGNEIMNTYTATVKTGICVSNVYLSPLDYIPVMNIGIPIVFSSGERRIVVFEVNLTDIWQTIVTATIGQTGITYAVSHDGKVIAHPEPAFVGREIPYQIKPVLDNYEGSTQFADPFTDEQVIATYSPVGGQTGWGIVVQQDKDEINASIVKTGTTIIIVLLVLGLFGTVSNLFLIGGFTRPIRELTRTTRAIAQTGDLKKTGMTQRLDEVGQLSQAFDQMVDKVKNTESRLSTSEERYRLLFEHANDAILLIDESGIIECNHKSEEMFRTSHDQLVGKLYSELSAEMQPDGPNFSDKEQKLIGLAFSGQEQRFEWRYRKFDGDFFDADVSMNRLNIDDKPILMSVIRDISDRKRTEEALSRAQKEKEEAAVSERTRLARDLHDAVSQTLFSASIIADVLPRLWDKNKDEGRRRLEEVRQLTRGALAEMRTLLFELRPAALADADLGYLLHQLAESISGRTRIPVTVSIDGECNPQPEVKVALYRITQEALNNVAKHANASQGRVTVSCQSDELVLIINDNGKGFDVGSVRPESLGLGIIRDRAKGIGAELRIDSKIGIGSEVIVKLQNTRMEV